MSIEQLELTDAIPDIGGQAVLPQLIARAAAERLARQRQDQLFNLSGAATGLNKGPRDARLGLPRLVMRYNVANE